MHKQTDYRKLTMVLLVVGIGLGFVVVGCSDEDTDDILPNVVLSIDALDFEQVEVGAFRVETVTVKNLTSGNVIVERVTLNQSGLSDRRLFGSNRLVELETPFTIESNGARTIYVGFYPDEANEYLGKVVIESLTESTSKQETDLVDLQGVGYLNEE